MPLLLKRSIASFIDDFVVAVFFYIFQNIFIKFGFELNFFVYFLFLTPLFFKDIVFRNASIGKKIVGLVICNKDGSLPDFKILVKRAFLMYSVGYYYFLKGLCIDKIYFSELVYWEENTFGTKVINSKTRNK